MYASVLPYFVTRVCFYIQIVRKKKTASTKFVGQMNDVRQVTAYLNELVAIRGTMLGWIGDEY